MSGIIIFFVFSGIAAILWVGGQDLIAGRISAGDLSSFVFYAFLVAASTGFLSELASELQRAAGAAERIAQTLQTAADLSEHAAPLPLRCDCETACRFESVDFSYPAGTSRPAVSAVDFEISRGERMALVGPSGAGKSTLFHLLLRFYDPGSGTVRLCGEDLRDLALGDIRQYIGLVPQEPALFSTSVRDNIGFGRPDANEYEIIAAARQAEAHDFIAALENGYDTPIGEKGVRLPGGQRQRIAIARSILRGPGLLLLDEATSALDARSEAAVQAALERLMCDRTSIVIAHRPATVVCADRILLMGGGRITATGTHEQHQRVGALPPSGRPSVLDPAERHAKHAAELNGYPIDAAGPVRRNAAERAADSDVILDPVGDNPGEFTSSDAAFTVCRASSSRRNSCTLSSLSKCCCSC